MWDPTLAMRHHAQCGLTRMGMLLTCMSHADSLLAILAPRAPPKHVRERHDDEAADADWERSDPARFTLPANAAPAKKRLAAFLRRRLRLPDVVLVILFGVRPWAWAAFLAWIVGAPIAHRLDVSALRRSSSVLSWLAASACMQRCCMHGTTIAWDM